jgi:NTP pyrophosphatase (non-canonical NTP hydrolase)
MNLNDYGKMCHEANQKWWPSDVRTRNKGEAIALMHSELSEALEGERKDLMDEKLPHRKAAEVEFADTLIRIFDYCYAFGYDLEGAFQEKMAYNAVREDHKLENRMKEGGKKF